MPKDLPSSRYLSQHWLRFPCLYRDSPDSKTVSCHSHNQWPLSQTTFQKGGLAARVAVVEAGADSASSGSGSASSWNLLGHSDGSTATGPLGSHGQGSSDDNKNTRRRLDTFSSREEEHARRAVLLRYPCEQYRGGVSAWINRFWATTNAPALSKPTRIQCKTGSMCARLACETRAKCQDFVARYKDDGIPYEVDSPFCNAKKISRSASPSHLKTAKLENNLRLCGKFCPQSYENSSQKEMIQGPLLSLRSTPVHKFLASRIEETALENRVQTCPIWKRTGVCSH